MTRDEAIDVAYAAYRRMHGWGDRRTASGAMRRKIDQQLDRVYCMADTMLADEPCYQEHEVRDAVMVAYLASAYLMSGNADNR